MLFYHSATTALSGFISGTNRTRFKVTYIYYMCYDLLKYVHHNNINLKKKAERKIYTQFRHNEM